MKRLFLLFLFCTSTAFAQAAPQNQLDWTFDAVAAAPYNSTGFQMQRRIGDCTATTSFINLGPVIVPAARRYIDLAITPGVMYSYQLQALAPVTAANPAGNSGFSNCVAKMVPLPPMPVPGNLTVTFLQALIDALENLKTGMLNLQ